MAIPTNTLTTLPDTIEKYDFKSYYGLSGSGITTGEAQFAYDSRTNSWFYFNEETSEFVASSDPLNFVVEEEVTITEQENQNIITQEFLQQINSFLNETASSYGYDSIDNAISYYNSGITAWRNEAIAFNTWRDDTISLMYSNIFSFTSDGTALPDLLGFTSQPSYNDLNLSTPSRPTFS